MSGSLSKLVVSGLTISDEGRYRCRVDYSQAPTMIETVRLSILVPPSPPVIYDDHNVPLSRIVGPFHLGANISLKCITRGGRQQAAGSRPMCHLHFTTVWIFTPH